MRNKNRTLSFSSDKNFALLSIKQFSFYFYSYRILLDFSYFGFLYTSIELKHSIFFHVYCTLNPTQFYDIEPFKILFQSRNRDHFKFIITKSLEKWNKNHFCSSFGTDGNVQLARFMNKIISQCAWISFDMCVWMYCTYYIY